MRGLTPLMDAADQAEFAQLEPRVARHLLLYDEHTWGSAESISAPDAVHSLGQWNSKALQAYEAAAGAQRLWTLSARTLAGAIENADPAVLLFNPLPYPVKQHAVLPKLRGPEEFGGAWPLHEFARDLEMANPISPLYVAGPPVDYGLVTIPAGGYCTLTLAPREPQSVVTMDRWRMQNRWWDLRINPRTGAVSQLISRVDGYDWCDPDSSYGLADFVAHRLEHPQGRPYLQPGNPPRDVRPDLLIREGRVERVTHYHTSTGPGLRTLALRLETPHLRSLEMRYTLYDDEPWIDIAITLDRDESRHLESFYWVFPFRLNDSTFHYSQGGAVITGEEEQLPNACRDYYAVEDFAALSTPERHVVLMTPDIPLVLWGDFTVGAYQEHHAPHTPALISWPMNNYWHTNFKADQSGTLNFRYRLLLGQGPFHANAAMLQARAFALPLMAYPTLRSSAGQTGHPPATPQPAASSFIQCDPTVVRVLQCRTLEDRDGGRTLQLVFWGESTVDATRIRFGGGWQLTHSAVVDLNGHILRELVVQENSVVLPATRGTITALECAIKHEPSHGQNSTH
ncbi:MAG: hypothetical protein OWU33_16065 [Firmicutes bacterium]|nr:hypothetical protein [Bacillota bacterium]